MTTEEKYRRILSNHLPPQAVDMVYNYLNQHKVHFHITRGRASKLGDYRYSHNPLKPGEVPEGRRAVSYHEISINGDLNPYMFMMVFLHEAAHLETHLKYEKTRLSPSPHGHEWQSEYAALLNVHAALFPPEVQPLLKKYTRRIPLNRSLLRQIEEQLHHYDPDYSAEQHITLDRLLAERPDPAGIRFRLKSKPDILFEPLERRRTRWLCLDTTTGRCYTVAATAEITIE